ncbi:hypothetical protein NW752_006900 [Fusarium irregulare]|uniref:Uncharacterized protein n=1 Tax=Fusarium irregulare TaxID=2494466 RepID=A0A9W8UBJ7_9HYPO|nr:hypothetical protein NW766_005779 [Fusarium irregulare]KAJ4015967.1 hypothetical protein NW752_006900 [Fusarium irregulare]
MSDLPTTTTGSTPPSADFNPRDREKRERFIRDTFSHKRQWFPDKWKRVRAGAQNQVALRLHTLGLSWTGSSAFDYSVDFLAWLEYVRLLMLEGSGLRWPWDPDEIEIWELEEGISERYKTWLVDHGHQAGTPQNPKGRGDLGPSKLLDMQAASSQPSRKPTKAPDQTQGGLSTSRGPQPPKLSRSQKRPSATSREPQPDKRSQNQGGSRAIFPESSKPVSNRHTTSSMAHQWSSSQPTTRVLVCKSSSADSGKWKVLEEEFGRRFDTTLTKLRDDGFIGGEPTIRWGVMLPLRQPYRPAPKLKRPPPRLPDRNFRQHIWDALEILHRSKPYLGPFEVALTPWVDFLDLLFGERGTMFASIGGLIPRDVAIAWTKGRNGVPNSLVVGPNPILAHDPDSPTMRDGVHKVWRQVIQWLRLAQAGRPLRFSDFLRCFGTLKIGEDKSTVELMDDLFDACEAASRSPFAAHARIAQAKKENFIRWTPEIHAYLKVPSSHAGILLRKWVFQLGEVSANERATAVFDLWGQHSPTEALL